MEKASIKPNIYNLTDFFSNLSNLKEKFGTDNLFYRGQGNLDWKISSSAYRRLENNNIDLEPLNMHNYINNLINETRKRDFNRSLSDFDLLAEIQHKGGATNFIDFTKDACIALYMACSSQYNNSFPVIYFLNKDILQIEKLKFNSIDDFINDTNTDKTYYYYPALVNERIIKQSGFFLINQMGYIDKTTLLGNFIIDNNSVGRILQELSKFLNLNQETVYPDLQGFLNANNQYSSLNAKSELYENAISSYNNEFYYLAIKDLKVCIDNEINVQLSKKMIGVSYSKLYNNKESIIILEEYIEKTTNDAEVFYYLGLQYLRSLDSSAKELSKHYVLDANPVKSFEVSEKYFLKAIELAPKTVKYLITLADLYYGESMYWEDYGIKTRLGIFKRDLLIKAKDFYLNAFELTDSRKGKICTQLGIISLILDSKEDVNQYKEAIKWDKESKVTGFANLGAYFFDLYGKTNNQKHLKQGIYYSKQAIYFDKFHFNAYKNIVNALSNGDNFQFAIKLLVGFINEIPDSTSLIWRLFELLKKFNKSELSDSSVFSKVKKLLPNNEYVDCAYADRLLNQSKLDEAFDVLYKNFIENENYLLRIIFSKYHFLNNEIDLAMVNLEIASNMISSSEIRYAINVYLRRVDTISVQFTENNLEDRIEKWLIK